MKKKRIGLIFGGKSGEHEVSLVSAGNIAAGFDTTQYEVFPILISRDGRWYGPIPMDWIAQADAMDFSDREIMLAPYPGGKVLSAESGAEITALDGVFPIVHGNNGEDGTLQGLLELADVPYVGAGVASSAICMDKMLMRKVLHYHGVPQAEAVCVLRRELEASGEAVIEKVEQTLQYPAFVKPANGGSSVGTGMAHNREELLLKLWAAAEYDTKILVERAVSAREIEVAVLGNGDPVVSMPGEIVSCHEYYDYEAKYQSQDSICRIPADLSEEQTAQIRSMALEVYQALDCEGMARVDFFIDKVSGNILLNEVNSLPGFTDISMYPKMCEYIGIPLQELLNRLIGLAEERHADRKRNVITK